MVNDVSRKIHFFQVEWVKGNGERIQKDLKFIESILNSYSNQIIKLYNDELFIRRHGVKNNRSFWRLEKIRKDELPLKFNELHLKEDPLNLQEHEGLAEPSHFVIFDGKIIGAEYNHYGVRWVNSKLVRIINDYLSNNSTDVVRVEIKPIFRKELYNLLERFIEIRGITIKIATNYARLLAKEDPESFGKMFSAAELIDGVWLSLGVTIGSRKHVEISKFDRIKESIKRLLRHPEATENLRAINIRGRLEGEESIEEFNLLEEMLVSEKRVAKLDERSRAVNPESMFNAIVDSYYAFENELKEYIKRS
ncbi:hypothetical protein A3L12_08130 [Thermococcus sp. P6]|nr:hypothetical protein A3L12_08130 [Thermococcus sp. P6]